MRTKLVGYVLLMLAIIGLATQVHAYAQEDEEQTELLPTSIHIAITLLSSVLSVVLFVVSFLAYQTDRRSRFLFVMAAFFLFAVKGVMIALVDLNNLDLQIGLLKEIVRPFAGILTTLSSLLDLGALILFSLGILRK